MATYTATKALSTVQPKGLRVGLVAVTSFWSVTNSSSVGDVIQMVKVPANATPVYVTVQGYHGSGSATVGDGVSTARYINAYSFESVAALALVQGINVRYVPYTYSTDDTIDILLSAVSTSTLSGAWSLTCIYSMDT